MSSDPQHNRPHPTIIVDANGFCEEIDIDLAPLIEQIWMAGIETEMSCQEVSEGVAWIEFPNVGDVLQFLNIVVTYEPGVDTLYNRINHQFSGQMSAQPREYQLNILDLLEDQQEQIEYGLAGLDAMVGVYFPRTDIEVIVARLDAYNSAQNVTSR